MLHLNPSTCEIVYITKKNNSKKDIIKCKCITVCDAPFLTATESLLQTRKKERKEETSCAYLIHFRKKKKNLS